MATTNNIPTSWNDAEVLDGYEIVDKAKLIDVPFLITGVVKGHTNDDIAILYIDGEYANGEGFTFIDSSTGVKATLDVFLTAAGKGDAPDDEFIPVRILAPRGLRLSEYDRVDRITGRTTKGKTYYLTTSNKRRSDVAKTAAPKASRRTAS